MIESIEWDGKRITKPGCYKNVPMSVYHGDCTDGPSISTTGLKKIFLLIMILHSFPNTAQHVRVSFCGLWTNNSFC